MSVKISELPILDSLADNDVIAGVDTSANVTSKIEMATLKNYIDTNTQYTAGTNIDITNNVVSAPNVYNKTETDNLLSAKESLANKITSISSSSTNAQYPSAKSVYNHVSTTKTQIEETLGGVINETKERLDGDIEQLNDEVEELQNEVDSLSTIFNAFPTESGEGESLTLDDTAEVKFKRFDLKGNTSQTTYSGKNLLINTRDEGYTVTSNGITFKVNADKSITVTGTATDVASMSLNLSTPVTLSAGTYTLSKKETTDVQVAIWYDSASVWAAVRGNTTTIQKTISENTTFNTWRTLVVVYQGVTVNTTVYPMLEKSSTETSYEPYVGGTASPNPDYPQDVNVVSGDNEINVCGKNLLNVNTNIENYYISASGVPTYGTAHNYTELIPVEQGSYMFSGIGLDIGNNKRIHGYDSSGNWVEQIDSFQPTTTGNYSRTFTISNENIKYIRISYYKSDISVQLEKGSTATTYEPYQGNTYNIDLPEGIELCKIGNYQDYIYKDSDKWYLHKIIYKKIFDGTETIYIAGSFESRTIFDYHTGIILENYAGGSVVPNILCTHLISASQAANWVPGNITRRSQEPDSLLYTLGAGLTTTTALQWLVNNNVITYTPMAEPIVTEITYQPLIDQLNLLEKAMSKDGQTNISQVNNDLGFIIYAEAIKSLENVLDRLALVEE